MGAEEVNRTGRSARRRIFQAKGQQPDRTLKSRISAPKEQYFRQDAGPYRRRWNLSGERTEKDDRIICRFSLFFVGHSIKEGVQ
jgi:hypothetical protein